jgi:hypothetical protein
MFKRFKDYILLIFNGPDDKPSLRAYLATAIIIHALGLITWAFTNVATKSPTEAISAITIEFGFALGLLGVSAYSSGVIEKEKTKRAVEITKATGTIAPTESVILEKKE